MWTNQIPLCYIIGYNILRYQALPWHISYQETVCFLGGGALYSAFSTHPTENIRAMGISVQTLWVLVFRGVNDLPVEGSFRRNDPSLTNRIPNGSNGSTKTAACSGWEEPLGGTVLSLQALVSGFWFLLRKRGWRRAALPRTFVAHGREACDAVESARLPRSRAETPWQPTWLPRASDADRRGRCLSCPSPERLSCERQALCECFEYLSPINSVFGSTLLETERSSITTSAERPMRAAILRAPPGAGKASSHATTRADPCRDLPAPGVDNLSL